MAFIFSNSASFTEVLGIAGRSLTFSKWHVHPGTVDSAAIFSHICTACRYCTEVCPHEIPIPELFGALNSKRQEQPWQKVTGVSPADCIKCGKCEDICPQNLKIRELLTVAAEEL